MIRSCGKLYEIIFIFIITLSILLISVTGCSRERSFRFPTESEQEVQYMCELIFTPEYAHIIGPSRRRRIRQVIVLDSGINVIFTDANSFFLPIDTPLQVGETYRCARHVSHHKCQQGRNTDPLCLRDSPLRKDEW